MYICNADCVCVQRDHIESVQAAEGFQQQPIWYSRSKQNCFIPGTRQPFTIVCIPKLLSVSPNSTSHAIMCMSQDHFLSSIVSFHQRKLMLKEGEVLPDVGEVGGQPATKRTRAGKLAAAKSVQQTQPTEAVELTCLENPDSKLPPSGPHVIDLTGGWCFCC